MIQVIPNLGLQPYEKAITSIHMGGKFSAPKSETLPTVTSFRFSLKLAMVITLVPLYG
jgi:hypothetical protein